VSSERGGTSDGDTVGGNICDSIRNKVGSEECLQMLALRGS